MSNRILFSIIFLLMSISIYSQRRRTNNSNFNNVRNAISPGKMMSLYDKNNDGGIDREEAAAITMPVFLEKFDEIDANDDEVIDSDELKKFRNKRTKKKKKKFGSSKALIKQMDINNDGKLDEFEIALKENISLRSDFSKIDTNADGFIDRKELDLYLNKE